MKSVVIVEDHKVQREVLTKTLTQYSFKPVCGATIAQTRDLLKRHKDDAAVIILDMDLTKFPDYKEESQKQGAPITGIGLAKKILRESRVQRPEIIIHSIYADRVTYYKQAIEAGASAYSVKGNKADRHQFLALIQALALKHSFQPNSLNESEISRLAEGHANSFELLEYFCHGKLARELELCLANAPLVLLFREKSGKSEGLPELGKFVSVSDVSDIPSQEEFDYSALHHQIFSQLSHRSIYRTEAKFGANGKADKLKEFSFIQLVKIAEVEISLGIQDPFPVHDVLGEYPFSIESWANALTKHASPVLETFVQKLLFRWREKQSVKLERVATSVGLSANVQRRLSPLVPAQRPGTTEEVVEQIGGLRRLSEDLRDYNRTLSALLEGSRTQHRLVMGETIRLSDVIEEIKSDYDRLGHINEILFTVEADCRVPTGRNYFSLALRALVGWAFQRRAEVARGDTQVLHVRWTVQGNWLELYVQENSERLSKRIREAYLFEPMSPLHVAQMIVEVACHGELTDATDELQTKRGHLFKIRLLKN